MPVMRQLAWATWRRPGRALMAAFRLLLMLAFGSGLGCYAMFLLTGRPHWRQRALRIVLGTMGAVLLLGLLLFCQSSLSPSR